MKRTFIWATFFFAFSAIKRIIHSRWSGFYLCVNVLLTGSHTIAHHLSLEVYYRYPEIHSPLYCMQKDTHSLSLKYTPCCLQDVARLRISNAIFLMMRK